MSGTLARRRAQLRPFMPALRVARFALAVVVVVVLGVIAVRYVPFETLTWWLLVPALLAAGVWWVLLARGWALLVSGRTTRHDLSRWCQTQVLRYLPGGIWAPTSRVFVVDGTPIDRVATVLAENVVSLCAALALGGAALALSGRPAWAAAVLAVIVPVVAARFGAERTRLDRPRVVRATVNGLVAFVAYMVCAILVQAAVSGWHRPLLVAGAAGISWSAGLVVVFSPGGLGVRELAYAGLLASDFGHEDLAAAAVVMRAVTIVAELVILLAAGRPTPHADAKNS
jgi:hypothetical protein